MRYPREQSATANYSDKLKGYPQNVDSESAEIRKLRISQARDLSGGPATAGLGYAEGAVLARQFGAWQVICWALVLSTPILLPIVLPHMPSNFSSIPLNALLGFLYVSVFSMFLGFFAWYQGR